MQQKLCSFLRSARVLVLLSSAGGASGLWAAPDLTITKTHSGNFTQSGSGSYTLTVANVGTTATSGTITVTDPVPTGLTPASVTGTGWACSISRQTVTCTRSTALAANAKANAIVLNVNIAANSPLSVTNTATVSGGGETNTVNDSASDPTTINAATAGAPVSDDFNTVTLNTGLWKFVNPVGDGTVSVDGSEVILSVPAGRTHDLWTGGNDSARILQTIGNVDFNVEAKFNTTVTSTVQDEGLIVAQDAGSYLRFDVYSAGSTVYFFSQAFANNNPMGGFSVPIGSPGGPIWLRVQRQGNSWTGSWSTDGSNFTVGGTYSYALTVQQIGPFAGNNGSPAPAFSAKVDYFHNLGTGVTAVPDLSITKSHSGTFTQGGTGSYTVTAKNAGTGPTSGTITITDAVPTGLTPTNASGTGWSCGVSGQTVTCTSTNILAAGVTGNAITLTVGIASNAASSVTNTATVSGGGDTNTANNSASDPTTINASGAAGPDLTITKTHSGNFTQSGSGSYTLTVANVGTAATSGTITVTDPVPTGLTPASATGTGWACSISGQTVTCTRSTALAADTSANAIVLNVNIAANSPLSVTNTATVSGGGETNTVNDSASDPTTINAATAGAPVSDDFNTATLNTGLWKFVNPVGDGTVSVDGSEVILSVPAGRTHDLWTGGNDSARILQTIGNVDFNVEAKFNTTVTSTVQDEGLIVAQDAGSYLRFDVYSAGSTVYFFSQAFANNNPMGGFSVPIGSPGGPIWLRVQRQGNSWTGSWSTDGSNFTVGGTYSYALTVQQIGPFAGNNGSPAPAFSAKVDYFHNLGTGVTAVPDLSITKSHSGTFTQGGTGSYTVTAKNAGTGPTSGTITITDAVPTGLTPTNASGTGWSCGVSGQTVTCTSTNILAAGVTGNAITLTVGIASNAPSSVTNTATVSGGGDTNTANNSASDPTTINASGAAGPDLTITKTHSGNFTAIGQRIVHADGSERRDGGHEWDDYGDRSGAHGIDAGERHRNRMGVQHLGADGDLYTQHSASGERQRECNRLKCQHCRQLAAKCDQHSDGVRRRGNKYGQ